MVAREPMRTTLAALSTLLGCLTLASLVAPSAVVAQDLDSAGEQQMLARINAMRAAQQLAPLARHEGLDAAARVHSADMAAQGQLTHVSATTGTPADRVRRAGVGATTVAENVALHRTTDEAHQALLGSDAHRTNMMSRDVSHIGLAALRAERGVYVTQVFAALAGASPAVAAAAPAPVGPPAPAAPPVAEAPTPAEAPAAPVQADGCFSPLPGVRICSPASPAAPPLEPAPSPRAPEPAPAVPAGPLVVQPGSNGTVVVQHTPEGAIQGYWVFGSGRWWWFPRPAEAQPGQQLQPDLRVTQPPAGFPPHPFGAQPGSMGPDPRAWSAAPVVPTPSPLLAQPPPVAAPGAFYTVPPPPMMGQPDRSWRRAHSQWVRAYQRWLREQAQLRTRSL